jgi:hypothetical protein
VTVNLALLAFSSHTIGRKAGSHQLSVPKRSEHRFIASSTTSGRSTGEQRSSRMGGETVALGEAEVVGRRSGPNQRHPSSPDVNQRCPAADSSSALVPESSRRW